MLCVRSVSDSDVCLRSVYVMTLTVMCVCVQNVPFEATAKELRQLLGTFGQVSIPPLEPLTLISLVLVTFIIPIILVTLITLVTLLPLITLVTP